MNWLLIIVILLIVVGCAVAMGEGATACLDIDSRSALLVDTAASGAAPKSVSRSVDPAGVSCQGGGGTHP